MLNKIKIVGKVLPTIQIKEKSEPRGLLVYFSLLVNNPNGVQTVLRCHANGEIATKIEAEVREEEILEVRGYLRREREGLQIVINVVDFTKLTEEQENLVINQARLLGEIITDPEIQKKEDGKETISFKVKVPIKENFFSLFFCWATGELASEISKRLKKRDIVLLGGFLQTIKIISEDTNTEKVDRISSFICQTFFLLDRSKADNFYSWENIAPISKETEKIDFSKPKKDKKRILKW